MRLLYTICTYQGKQYTMTEDMEDNTLLYTDDRDLADESFTEIEEGTWRKIVDPWDLKDVYHIDIYGIYRGHRVMIIGGNDRLQTLIICIYDEVLAEEWGMKWEGLGEGYAKVVPREEVETVQTREKWYWKVKRWVPLGSINLKDLSLAIEPMRRWADEGLLEEMRQAMESRSAEEREEMILALEKVYEEKGRLLTMEDLPEVKQSLGL